MLAKLAFGRLCSVLRGEGDNFGHDVDPNAPELENDAGLELRKRQEEEEQQVCPFVRVVRMSWYWWMYAARSIELSMS